MRYFLFKVKHIAETFSRRIYIKFYVYSLTKITYITIIKKRLIFLNINQFLS